MGALLIRRQSTVDRLLNLGAKCARWSGGVEATGGGGLGLLYAWLGVVVSDEVAALPLCLGRLEEEVGRAE